MNTTEQKRRIKMRKTPGGWVLEVDNASWAEMMTGLSIAIDACKDEPERAAGLRTLRTALSRAEISR